MLNQLLMLSVTIGSAFESVLFYREARTGAVEHSVHVLRALLYAYFTVLHLACWITEGHA